MPSRTDLFGQLWKEYSLSDSRYLTQDSFVVTMEAITAIFWGPLSFACVYCIATAHPMRHPLQLIISLGQLYGDVLYYATCTFTALVNGIHFCRPEDFYFWAYYFLCNFFWIVIPFCLIVSSVKAMNKAFAQVQAAEKTKKGL
jgi:cholestenol delta-isomerase